jgi:hypothetical protein
LIDYRPYGDPSAGPDLEAAKAEMRLSAYDTDGDGLCDAEQCREIQYAAAEEAGSLLEVVRDGFAQLGLELAAGEPLEPFEAFEDPSLRAAFFIPQGWARDYLSASNFFIGQFYSPSALGGEHGNGSLVGASPEQLAGWGYDVLTVPNVDSRIESCVPLTGSAQFECWAALDQYLVEEVVPSIPIGSGLSPILGSLRVYGYAWDELATAPAYDRIVLAP